MERTISSIIKGLKLYGATGKAAFEYVQADRVKVCVNGEYFGLWDCEKSTFVD